MTVQDGAPTALSADVGAGLDAMIHTRDQRRGTEGDQKDISFVAEVGPEYLYGGAT